MSLSVGLLGFGRFGRAFAERLIEGGVSVRALDPKSDVPEPLAASSVADLLQGARYVIFTVPIAQTETALRQLRPHLGGSHLVMDVGSVKSGPFALMEEVLGRDVPWLATHPLFGPTSLALGERKLRVVVCPNGMHPDAVDRARPLFAAAGCELVEMSPEEHDRSMAKNHALAYFVAKGILDIGLTLDDPLAPPSVQALARTVRSVREDAGHLFASLHRENPYSGDVRRKLIQALESTDEALREPAPADEVAHEEEAGLRIPAPEVPEQLRAARDVIDHIDRELIDLLARRAEVALRAGKAKADVGRGVRDLAREAELLDVRRELAREMGLKEDAVTEIFEAVLRFSRSLQSDQGDA